MNHGVTNGNWNDAVNNATWQNGLTVAIYAVCQKRMKMVLAQHISQSISQLALASATRVRTGGRAPLLQQRHSHAHAHLRPMVPRVRIYTQSVMGHLNFN